MPAHRFLFLVALSFTVSCGVGSPNDDEDVDDEVTDAECHPQTCDDLEATCGVAPDGCGGAISCGQCPLAGQTCGAAGPNRCGFGSCTATTCDGLSAQCGTLSDGCADVIRCGSCDDDEVCGADLTCCIQAQTCASLGASCGTIDDGCGHVVECGTCAAGETCGAGGPYRCGLGACAPSSCDDVDAECGLAPDGCSGQLDCGPCAGWETCGLLEPNRCDAVCAGDCPLDFACDDEGVCAGGSASSLTLDVRVPPWVRVSGKVTRNGAPVERNPDSTLSEMCATVSFESLDGFGGAAKLACADAAGTIRYEHVDLVAGRYRVTVQGEDDYYGRETDLPVFPIVVHDDVRLDEDRVLDVDVRAAEWIEVAGEVTADGVPLVRGPDTLGSPCVVVTFNSVEGWPRTAANACMDGNGRFPYDVTLLAGHYRVGVIGQTYYDRTTNLPALEIVARPDVSLQSDTALDLDVDAPDFVGVSGLITLNGERVPVAPQATGTPMLYVTFTSLDGWPTVSTTSIEGSDGFRYSGATLLAGRYTVTVQGESVYGRTTGVPGVPITVEQNVEIPADRVLNLDVRAPAWVNISGTVTENGGPLHQQPLSSGLRCATVQFISLDGWPATAKAVCEDATGVVRYEDVELVVGRYEVRVAGDYPATSGSLIPRTSLRALAEVNLVEDRVLDIDVTLPELIAVSGALTTNGRAIADQFPSSPCVYVVFASLDGYGDVVSSVCADAFGEVRYDDVALLAGRYRVTMTGNTFAAPPDSIPNVTIVVHEEIVLREDGTLDLDAAMPEWVAVSGLITMNGGPVMPGPVEGTYRCLYLSLESLEGLPGTSKSVCEDTEGAYRFSEMYVVGGRYRAVVQGDEYYGRTTLVPPVANVVVERVELR